MNATYEIADRSIQAYDAYVFAAVGRGFSANVADTLAAIAVVDCEAASHDRSVNLFTRQLYAARAVEFRNIVG